MALEGGRCDKVASSRPHYASFGPIYKWPQTHAPQRPTAGPRPEVPTPDWWFQVIEKGCEEGVTFQNV